MAELILDSRGRYQSAPPFLALATARERSVGRLALTLGLGGLLAVVAALLTGALCMGLAAAWMARAPDVSFAEAYAQLAQRTPEGRGLLSFWFEFSLVGLSSIAAAGTLLAVAARVQGRPALTFLTAATRFRWRLVGWGLVAGLLVIGAGLLLERLWAPEDLVPPILASGEAWSGRLGYLGLALVFLFLAALAEEIIFRGWLLQQLAAWTRSIPVILGVNGLVFSLVHFDPDVSAFLVRWLMGAGWAWIALRLGGIEFTTGAHLANNVLVSLFVAPVSLAPGVARDLDLRAVALELGIMLVLVGLSELMVRRRRAAVG